MKHKIVMQLDDGEIYKCVVSVQQLDPTGTKIAAAECFAALISAFDRDSFFLGRYYAGESSELNIQNEFG